MAYENEVLKFTAASHKNTATFRLFAFGAAMTTQNDEKLEGGSQ